MYQVSQASWRLALHLPDESDPVPPPAAPELQHHPRLQLGSAVFSQREDRELQVTAEVQTFLLAMFKLKLDLKYEDKFSII